MSPEGIINRALLIFQHNKYMIQISLSMIGFAVISDI